MVTELGEIIDIISKTENLAIIISIISLGVAIFRPMMVSYFNNKKIPILEFDGVYKTNTVGGIDYFIKVKRDKGEGEAEGVKGFVGITDKIELQPTLWWIGRTIETDISTYNYLSLFKTLEHNKQKIITFPNIYETTPPDFDFLLENCPFTKFKDDKLIVKINAKRGRIKEKQYPKNIDDIVKEAKPIPS
ncbi:MAG TPA: hypothetical protein VF242_06010 [Nitrososphaeraceae archaeon]